jgi:hypothetical protein
MNSKIWILIAVLLIGIILLIIFLTKKPAKSASIVCPEGQASVWNEVTKTYDCVDDPFIDFPKIGGALIIGNSADIPINVFLDPNKPPYAKGKSLSTTWSSTSPPTEAQLTQVWGESDAQFFLSSSSSGIARIKGSYKQQLQPSEYWIIVLPKDEANLPIWCSGLNNPDSCINALGPCGVEGCTGSGGWVERVSANVPPDAYGVHRIQPALRFEFNFDAASNQIYFNLSAVDGINSSILLNYNGDDRCPAPTTKCALSNLEQCPFQAPESIIPSSWNYSTCVSPVPLSNSKDSPFSQALCGNTKCAGCGGNIDEESRCKCRQWWQTNEDALKWKDFIQKSKECNIYSWAYDELLLKDPSKCGEMIANEIRPLLKCTKSPTGSLRVKVVKVL